MDYLLVETQAYPKSLMKASYRQFCTKASFHFGNSFRLYSESIKPTLTKREGPCNTFLFHCIPSLRRTKQKPARRLARKVFNIRQQSASKNDVNDMTSYPSNVRASAVPGAAHYSVSYQSPLFRPHHDSCMYTIPAASGAISVADTHRYRCSAFPFSQSIGKCQYHTPRPTGRFTQHDKGSVTE